LLGDAFQRLLALVKLRLAARQYSLAILEMRLGLLQFGSLRAALASDKVLERQAIVFQLPHFLIELQVPLRQHRLRVVEIARPHAERFGKLLDLAHFLLDDAKPFEAEQGGFNLALAELESPLVGGKRVGAFGVCGARLMKLRTLKLDLPGLLGKSALVLRELRLLREDASLARVELRFTSIKGNSLVAGPLVLDVQLRFALVQLSLPLFALLPRLIKLVLPRAASGRFEVESVELSALLRQSKLKLNFLRRDPAFALGELGKPLSNLVGLLQLGLGQFVSLQLALFALGELLFQFGQLRLSLIDPQAGVANAGVEFRFLRVQARFAAVDVGQSLL
jgi:hypothetical protein